MKWNKAWRTLDIGTMFWIEFSTCRTNYRCGITFHTDNYTNSIELALFYPTIIFAYSKKRFRNLMKESK